MKRPRITLDTLWATFVPYELWIDLVLNPRMFVPEVDPRQRLWRGWIQLKRYEPATTDVESLDVALRETKFFPLAMSLKHRVDESVPETEQQIFPAENPFRLVRRSARLFLNNYSQFQLVCQFELEPVAGCDGEELKAFATETVVALNRNRTMFENLGQSAWIRELELDVTAEIRRLLREALGRRYSEELIQEVRLQHGATYPLTRTNIGDLGPLDAVFAANETPTQSRRQPALTRDVPGAFGHMGWAYSVISGIPYDQSTWVVPIMIYMQFNFFQIRYFQHYAYESMQSAGLHETRRQLERKAERFEQLFFHFQRFALEYQRFRGALYSKYGDVAVEVERHWNLDTGLEALDRAFGAQRDFLQRRFARAEEKVIKRQSIYLYVIALLSLLGLYSVVESVFSLYGRYPSVAQTITGACLLGLLFGLWMLVRPERPS